MTPHASVGPKLMARPPASQLERSMSGDQGTSFLPFDFPASVAAAFDIPTRLIASGPRNDVQGARSPTSPLRNKNDGVRGPIPARHLEEAPGQLYGIGMGAGYKKGYGAADSFGPFEGKSDKARFGFKSLSLSLIARGRAAEREREGFKKDKRGTIDLPIMHPPPSALPGRPTRIQRPYQPGSVSSLSITPVESIDSLASHTSASPSVAQPALRPAPPPLSSAIPRIPPRRVDAQPTSRFGYNPSHAHSNSSSSTVHARSPSKSTMIGMPTVPSYTPSTSYDRRPTAQRHISSPSSDERAVAALEQLSHHLLAETKIPGYRHRTIAPGEDAYERTRAAPRSKKQPTGAPSEPARDVGLRESYVMVNRPSEAGHANTKRFGYSGQAGGLSETQEQPQSPAPDRQSTQSASLRGWRKIRPTSTQSSGKDGQGKKDRPVSEGQHRRILYRALAPLPPPMTDLPPVPSLPPTMQPRDASGVSATGDAKGRIGRGIVRMRSISSTHRFGLSSSAEKDRVGTVSAGSHSTSISSISSAQEWLRPAPVVLRSHTDPTRATPPPIPPRSASRPQAIRRVSENSVVSGTGMYVPLVLSPSREETTLRDKLAPLAGAMEGMRELLSPTPTEMMLLNPRRSPVQLGPLPPPPHPIPVPQPEAPFDSVQPGGHPPTRKNSLLNSQTRLAKLRIKRHASDSSTVDPPVATTPQPYTYGHAQEQGLSRIDSIAEEGMRVLAEVRKREKLAPRIEIRDTRRRPSRIEIGSVDVEADTETEAVEDTDITPVSQGNGPKVRAQTRKQTGGGMTALSFLALSDHDLDLRFDLGGPVQPDNRLARPSVGHERSDGTGTSQGLCDTMLYSPATKATSHPLGQAARPRDSLESQTLGRPCTPLITHIIPPEERSRIGPSAPPTIRIRRRRESDSDDSSADELTHGLHLARHLAANAARQDVFSDRSNPPALPEAEEEMMPVHLTPSPSRKASDRAITPTPGDSSRRPRPALAILSTPGSWTGTDSGPPTALSPPPRSRRTTASVRTGSTPAGLSSGSYAIGQPLFQEPVLGSKQGQRSLSLGALATLNPSSPPIITPATGASTADFDLITPLPATPGSSTRPIPLFGPITPPATGPGRSNLLMRRSSRHARKDSDDGVEPLLTPSPTSKRQVMASAVPPALYGGRQGRPMSMFGEAGAGEEVESDADPE